MKKVFYTIPLILAVTLITILFIYILRPISNTTNCYSPNYYIAHAGGAIKGHTYTNSLEAVQSSIQNGYKYIEVDLSITSDSQVVCMHSSEEFRRMTESSDNCQITLQYFKKQKIYGKYTPLTAEDVIGLVKENDITLVTDKISNPYIINKHFSLIRKKIMVEAFSIEDHQKLTQLGYTPMLYVRINLKTPYIILKALKRTKPIEWISTSIHSKNDIYLLRILKRLYNVKVAVYTPLPPYLFKDNIGKEIDLLYIDDKNKMKL